MENGYPDGHHYRFQLYGKLARATYLLLYNTLMTARNTQIDLTPNLKEVPLEAVVISTVMPHEPAYRGSSDKTYDPHFASESGKVKLDIKAKATDRGRNSTWNERKTWSKWKSRRVAKGYPTWTSMADDDGDSPFASHSGSAQIRDVENADEEGNGIDQAGLHEWCQAYCSSLQPMREFILKKEIWGWDEEGVLLGMYRSVVVSSLLFANR